MKLGITFLEMKEMKEKMDLVWNSLFEESLPKNRDDFESFERLPKFEGTGRRSFRSSSAKHN